MAQDTYIASPYLRPEHTMLLRIIIPLYFQTTFSIFVNLYLSVFTAAIKSCTLACPVSLCFYLRQHTGWKGMYRKNNKSFCTQIITHMSGNNSIMEQVQSTTFAQSNTMWYTRKTAPAHCNPDRDCIMQCPQRTAAPRDQNWEEGRSLFLHLYATDSASSHIPGPLGYMHTTFLCI